MKNTRKFLAMLLTLTAVLALFACDSNDDGGGDSPCQNGCVDLNSDCKCDVCKKVIPCVDENSDCECDNCKKVIPCADENSDCECDSCKKVIPCVDENSDCECDVCGKEFSCVDKNSDKKCDVCGSSTAVSLLKLGGEDMTGYVIATDFTDSTYVTAAQNLRNKLYQDTGYYFSTVNISGAPERAIVIRSIDKISGPDSFKVSVSGKRLIIDCAYDNMLARAIDAFVSDALIGKGGVVDFRETVFKKDISVVCYDDFGAKGDGVTDDFEAFYNTHVFANGGGQTVIATPGKTYLLRDSYMGTSSVKIIPIKTNVNWNGANIIIDDTEMARLSGHVKNSQASKHIFSVLPDDAHQKVTIYDSAILDRIVREGLNPDTKAIDLGLSGWDGAVMIIPYDSSHKVFRRLNYSQFKGEDMNEIIIVSANGKISSETPVTFNYTRLYKIEVYKIDPASAITIENGNITTLSSKVNHKVNGSYTSTSIARGINVARSYTTVKNVNHSVVDGITLRDRIEMGIEGASYSGFFRAEYSTNVTFKDCEIPGRMCYNNSSTYNFISYRANKVVLDGCVQPNFWVTVDPVTYEIKNATDDLGNRTSEDAILGRSSLTVESGTAYTLQWGLGNSNYCKNLEYINSTLSRFDAHAGLYNGKIVGCNIIDIELTGYGDFIIENTKKYSVDSKYASTILAMRSDYGCTWDGDVLIKDVDFYINPSPEANRRTSICSYVYRNWYFGYICAVPDITVDNLSLFNAYTFEPMPAGTEISHMTFKSYFMKMHLLDSGVDAVFSVVDNDGDGYVDDPLYDINRDGIADASDMWDVDGNGRIGNTSISYSAAKAAMGSDRKGIKHGQMNMPAVTANLCIIRPPRYFKVLNNNGRYKFNIWNTSGEGISDGMWYSNTDTMNGFFGSTMFYYGSGIADFFVGTNPALMPENSTFLITEVPQA